MFTGVGTATAQYALRISDKSPFIFYIL